MKTKGIILPLLFISIFLTFNACKKKDNSSPEPDNTTNTPTTQTGNYAVFASRKQAIITSTLISSLDNFSTAYASSSTLINNSPTVGSLLDMGAMNLNGTIFQKNAYSVANMYGDSTSSTFNTPHNWIISGTSAVPGFSYSNTNPYPTYTGYTAIADSFIVSGNITIPLTNYSGSDEIETYFVTSTNPVANTSIQNITGSPASINFTSTDLSIIGVNSNVSLVINFYKNNIQTINGKSYNFRTGYGIIKSNIKFR
ncbi:MAG: hypothetical protein K0S53_2138 [Bacteroidetes bacterium]|jgi:hypothetical protein|nr:hypothetical protein [Bacteroidota bacterium]MDF2452188.1 hypothetical protein [Bacteroidota bacterium]